MAGIGPPPTPTAVLKMRGSLRATRGRRDEPKPDRKRPRRPQSMCERAKRIWTDLVPHLDKMGVLTVVDGKPLERYCELCAKWEATREAPGAVELRDLLKLNEAMLKLEVQFGMTPAARPRLVAQPKEKKTAEPAKDPGRFFRTA